MKPSAFAYRRPASLQEALSLLEQGDDVKIIAGGQSLVPAMNLRMATPGVLVDLAGIESLSALNVEDDGSLSAGAMVAHNRFLRDAQVGAGWPAIPLAVKHVAHEQVRNRGTIGGSLCHADPAAEWAAVCLLLDAEMKLAGRLGARVLPAGEFIKGVYETALEPGEVLCQVRFPAPLRGWRWGFHEIARRRGDFAMAGALAGLAIDDSGLISAARLVVFAAEDRARRLDAALVGVVGCKPDEIDPDLAGLAAAAEVDPRSDLHASAALRFHLVHSCVVRALVEAAGKPAGVRND
ncbi:FAD binding domain-containing protein [Candidimonas nitroreducens]|uniref:Molybdopterin dehydrogenase n=1 Tax=Candidimonas nitroreducens TaxID=683354 RepID=A0A225M0D4_9BURK|nr:xanthine dehydrogenase family protein subunit M [Candidimonas nitroreducens]OWT54844.1 molybdopterin dehydrogenase [Candidimonas nitroreducens]